MGNATIAALWRYPVKSMAGERVDTASLGPAGVQGDRGYAVIDAESGLVASAKHPRRWGALLTCSARWTGTTVEITLPDGDITSADDPDIDARLSAALGRPVRLTPATEATEAATAATADKADKGRYTAVWPALEGVVPDEFRERFAVDEQDPDGNVTELGLAAGWFLDVAPLHIVTTATLRGLGQLAPDSTFAVERFRPNIVLDAPGPAFAENEWPGGVLGLGDGLAAKPFLATMRCIMTTLPQGELPADRAILRTISEHNRRELPGLGTWSCVGAYAAVEGSGTVTTGDRVTVELC